QVRILVRSVLFHLLDPGVLVRRVRCRGQDGDLAGATDLVGDEVDLRAGDAVGVRLVDEQVAAFGVGVGVEGDDLDSGVLRLDERVADRRRVVRRDGDGADLLLGEGVDVAHLCVGGGLGGADLGERPTDFLERRFATFGGGIEVRVTEVLRQEGYRDVPAIAGAGVCVPSFVPVVRAARAGR